jgi:5-methylcytosine-specific restriction endonuclease McrA
MYPINEFKFENLKSELNLKYIEIHNNVVESLTNLKNITSDKEIKKYLKELLVLLKKLKTKESEITKSIICFNKKKIESVRTIANNDIVMQQAISNEEFSKHKSFKTLSSYLKSHKNYKIDKKTNFFLKDVLLAVFNYEGVRSSLLEFYKAQNFQVCLYCLAQYTSSYTSDNSKVYLTGNLDHIKSKDINPAISICLNNLVPVCAHCNQRKSNNPFDYNPFDLTHEHKFDFSLCLNLNEKGDVVFESIEKLEINTDNEEAKDLAIKLDYKLLYRNFVESGEILVSRFQRFNADGYKDSLKKIANEEDPESALRYFISDVPLKKENILKFPLTKFKIDLYNDVLALSKTNRKIPK